VLNGKVSNSCAHLECSAHMLQAKRRKRWVKRRIRRPYRLLSLSLQLRVSLAF
jgi:hypothetical protein